MFDLLDLPTHLPNETPVIEQQPDQTQQPESLETETLIEETEPPKLKESICIPGTSIKLETEEDIAKWIEERKKKWPSQKNIEQKLKDQSERKREKRKLEDTSPTSSFKRIKSICKYYQQFKKCKFGDKCKNLHSLSNEPNPIALKFNDTTHYRKFLNGIPILIPKLYSNRVENTNVSKSSLFKHLITQDQMNNENKVVIDFIQYLNQQNMINHDVMK